MSVEQLLLGRADIALAADTSLNVVDDAIRLGHLKTFLFGRRRKATAQAVQDWIVFLERESDAGRPVHYRPAPPRRAPDERPDTT